MTREAIWFAGPREISVSREPVDPLRPVEVLVENSLSAISAGTELLVYRNEVPENMPLDQTIAAYRSGFTYPVKYGYASVGTIVECGAQVDSSWQGRRVFAFHCHESAFVSLPEKLELVPDDVADEDAVFLANMETAVTLVLDGRPLIGERVAVYGQGVVGLLTTALLSQFPLAELRVLDRYRRRLETARALGATTALLSTEDFGGESDVFDLAFELAGSEQALQRAINSAAYSGRIVLGSWYGSRPATVHLGGSFHRKRLTIVSSQVSTLSPELTGRWSKRRRFDTAWEAIRRINPSRLISHRYPAAQAMAAFERLDTSPEDMLQVVLEYAHS